MTVIDPIEPRLAEWCWRNHKIEPLLHRWQLQAYRKRKACLAKGQLRFVICASATLGKSCFLFTLATMYCLENPGSEVLYSAPAENSLAEFLRAVVDVVWEHLSSGMRPHYISSEKTFTFKNGSHLTLRGMNMKSHTRRRGGKWGLVIIDEAAFIDELGYVVEKVIMPRVRKGSGTLILSSTPPDNPQHDFEFICQAAEAGGYYHHASIYEGNRTPEEIEDIKATTDPEAWRIEFLAERGLNGTPRAITPEFTKEMVAEVPKHPCSQYFRWYEFLDQGSVDSTACAFAYWHPVMKKLIVAGELVVPGEEVLPEPFAASVKELEKELGVKEPNRLCDISEGIFTRQLGMLGLSFTKAPTKDLQGSVKSFRQMLRNKEAIISPRCQKLIACLEGGEWNASRSAFNRTKSLSHVDILAATIQLSVNISQADNIPDYIDRVTGVKAKPKVVKYNPLAEMLKEPEKKDKDWKSDIGIVAESKFL